MKAFEQQKKEEWVPALGSMVFVPRMKGKFKVTLMPCWGTVACVLCLTGGAVLSSTSSIELVANVACRSDIDSAIELRCRL